ncbi:unnamed protein product, partial [marine sediment metagenome]
RSALLLYQTILPVTLGALLYLVVACRKVKVKVKMEGSSVGVQKAAQKRKNAGGAAVPGGGVVRKKSKS